MLLCFKTLNNSILNKHFSIFYPCINFRTKEPFFYDSFYVSIIFSNKEAQK